MGFREGPRDGREDGRPLWELVAVGSATGMDSFWFGRSSEVLDDLLDTGRVGLMVWPFLWRFSCLPFFLCDFDFFLAFLLEAVLEDEDEEGNSPALSRSSLPLSFSTPAAGLSSPRLTSPFRAAKVVSSFDGPN